MPHTAAQVGKEYRKRKAEAAAAAEEFEEADTARRKQILNEHREQLLLSARAKLDAAIRAANLPPAELPSDGSAENSSAEDSSGSTQYHAMLVQPRPAAQAGTLRYRFLYDRRRSHAYPMFPAEDRPSLGRLDA